MTLRRLLIMALLPLAACKTVGITVTEGGYSEVAPQIANEMMLDTRGLVVIDIRPAEMFRGPDGHIAGAINAPFESIEKQLPELLPYQNQTVLVYGSTSTDGALAAGLLSVAGFRNVVHIDGGIASWIALGYRTVNVH